jgi:hypothetical protein
MSYWKIPAKVEHKDYNGGKQRIKNRGSNLTGPGTVLKAMRKETQKLW